MIDKTQSLLPVTQADRDLAADLHHWYNGQITAAEEIMRAGHYDDDDRVQMVARHRISHCLPGDVGTGADAQRNIVRAVIDCYNTARPAGLSPVEYVHSKRLVRDAFAALSNVSVQIEQDEILDLIDDAISDSFDEEWNSRMGARHIVGALEHAGWAVVPLAALTPSPCPGDGMREAPWGHCKVAFFDDGEPDCDVERVWDTFGPGKGGKLPKGWEFCESGISGASGFYVLFDVEGVPDPRDGAVVRNALADLGFMSRAALTKGAE